MHHAINYFLKLIHIFNTGGYKNTFEHKICSPIVVNHNCAT